MFYFLKKSLLFMIKKSFTITLHSLFEKQIIIIEISLFIVWILSNWFGSEKLLILSSILKVKPLQKQSG